MSLPPLCHPVHRARGVDLHIVSLMEMTLQCREHGVAVLCDSLNMARRLPPILSSSSLSVSLYLSLSLSLPLCDSLSFAVMHLPPQLGDVGGCCVCCVSLISQ